MSLKDIPPFVQLILGIWIIAGLVAICIQKHEPIKAAAEITLYVGIGYLLLRL